MKVAIFHAAAGHGHLQVARVAEKAFKEHAPEVQVTVEDILDSTSWVFKRAYPGIYFNSVKYTPGMWGWFYETLDRQPWYNLLHPIRTTGNRFEGRKVLKRIQEEDPDVIICTHFYSAELFSRARVEGTLRAKVVVVLTDFYPHTFWVHPGTDAYWIMSEEGKQNLLGRGVPAEKIHTGGVPVDPRFLPSGEKNSLRKKYGVERDRFTLLLTSGSFGLGPQEQILESLKPFADKVQCFVVCGNNQTMKKKLDAMTFDFPVKVFGFIDFMDELMEASDLMVAKSGGSTTVESLAKGLPMVIMRPIPGQETRNAFLLKERGASFFLEEPHQIELIMQNIFREPSLMEARREAIRNLAKPHAAEDLIKFVTGELCS